MGGNKHPADLLGNFLNSFQAALFSDLFHQLVGIQASFLQDLPQNGIDLDHFRTVHNISDINIAKNRLYAGGTGGQQRQGSGRGDCGNRSVSLGKLLIQSALLEQREGSAGLCQLPAFLTARLSHRSHYGFRQPHGLLGVVGDFQPQQGIRPPHDSQADLAGLFGHKVDFLQRILIGVDHVIQKMHCFFGGSLQLVPVKGVNAVFFPKHFCQVD